MSPSSDILKNLAEKAGTLSQQRIRQIPDGIRLLTEPRDIDDKDCEEML